MVVSTFLASDREPRAFVVVSSSRSGSNLLLHYIRQVADAAAFGEIFRDDYLGMDAWTRLAKRLDLAAAAEALHRDRLSDFWELVLTRILARKRFAGAKIFYYHRRDDAIWDRFAQPDHRVIHLWRDSTFDQYVSRLQAMASGEWRSGREQSASRSAPLVEFDRSEYLEFRSARRRDIEDTRARYGGSDRYVEIEYSQLTDHARMATLLEGLFGQRVELEEKLQRQLPRPKIEYVADPDAAKPFTADSITGGFAQVG